jgi:hypothetical protein
MDLKRIGMWRLGVCGGASYLDFGQEHSRSSMVKPSGFCYPHCNCRKAISNMGLLTNKLTSMLSRLLIEMYTDLGV